METKMRKIFLALILAVLMAHADDTEPVNKVNIDSLVNEIAKLDLYSQSMEEPIQVAQSQCMGYATCWGHWGSYQVSCYSYGTGCTWEVFPGRGVRCTSIDSWGNYFYSWGRC